MRILFVTDLHGSTVVFLKALNAARSLKVDVFLVGGDLSGKRLLAIVPIGNGQFTVAEPSVPKAGREPGSDRVDSQKIRVLRRDELDTYCRRLEAKGFYWEIIEAPILDQINEDSTRVLRLFQDKIAARLIHWAEVATAQLPDDTSCYWIGGNDDEEEMLKAVVRHDLGRFQFGEGKLERIEDYELLSMGYTDKTPFKTSRELEDEELRDCLYRLIDTAADKRRVIMNVHVPPAQCGVLDVCIDPQRPSKLIHVGSTVVRSFIEDVQPVAHFAGHVHEGKGVAWIGETIVLNPGSEYHAGVLNGYLAIVRDRRVVEYRHYTW